MRGEYFGRFNVFLELLHVAFEFRPSVLEPGDDLRVAQPELTRDLVSIRGGKILLVQEPFLQLKDLVVCERCSRLPLFLGLLSVVEEVEVVRLSI